MGEGPQIAQVSLVRTAWPTTRVGVQGFEDFKGLGEGLAFGFRRFRV